MHGNALNCWIFFWRVASGCACTITVKFGEAVYVLHCFQKKSTRGITTPKPDMDLIRERLRAAEAHARGKTK
ncbi:MAG: type II toxin-antitoxin system RelE/ParE family toxin [Zoogloeaceae bacterium]|nr:type II toxin-antitoxin system RelE/ParE family toxin [Zoogloeaceae bacterium]